MVVARDFALCVQISRHFADQFWLQYRDCACQSEFAAFQLNSAVWKLSIGLSDAAGEAEAATSKGGLNATAIDCILCALGCICRGLAQ